MLEIIVSKKPAVYVPTCLGRVFSCEVHRSDLAEIDCRIFASDCRICPQMSKICSSSFKGENSLSNFLPLFCGPMIIFHEILFVKCISIYRCNPFNLSKFVVNSVSKFEQTKQLNYASTFDSYQGIWPSYPFFCFHGKYFYPKLFNIELY